MKQETQKQIDERLNKCDWCGNQIKTYHRSCEIAFFKAEKEHEEKNKLPMWQVITPNSPYYN